MSESVYRVTEVIGASPDSWEAAARNAVETAATTVRDLRVAEATRFDVTIQDGKVASMRLQKCCAWKLSPPRAINAAVHCRSGWYFNPHDTQ
jgi:hypothetical protein